MGGSRANRFLDMAYHCKANMTSHDDFCVRVRRYTTGHKDVFVGHDTVVVEGYVLSLEAHRKIAMVSMQHPWGEFEPQGR